jgi:hypothetical protein
VAEEIQLLECGYSAQCTVRGCRARATSSPDTPMARAGRSDRASCAIDTRIGSERIARCLKGYLERA